MKDFPSFQCECVKSNGSELYFISVAYGHLNYLGSNKKNKFYLFSLEKDFWVPVRILFLYHLFTENM